MTGPRSSSQDGKIKFTDVWCKVCKKPIGKRKSSMTSWIFQDSRCQCKQAEGNPAESMGGSSVTAVGTPGVAEQSAPMHKLSPEMEWQIAEESVKQEQTSTKRLLIVSAVLFAIWLVGVPEFFIAPVANFGILMVGLVGSLLIVVFADKFWRLIKRVRVQQRAPNLIQVTKFFTYGLLALCSVSGLALAVMLVRSVGNSSLRPIAEMVNISWMIVCSLVFLVVVPLLVATAIVAFRHEDEL